MALPASTVDIVLQEFSSDSDTANSVAVFKSDYNVDWTQGAFDLTLTRETTNQIQFVLYLSLDAYSLGERTAKMVGALNYLRVEPGSCGVSGDVICLMSYQCLYLCTF